MNTFKLFIKIILRYKIGLGIFISLCLAGAGLMAFHPPSRGLDEFHPLQVRVGVEDLDGSPVSRGLVEFLSEHYDVMAISRADVSVSNQDDLSLVMFIPYGFGEALSKTESLPVELIVLNERPGALIQLQLNHYLNTGEKYLRAGYSQREAVEQTLQDLNLRAEVSFVQERGSSIQAYLYFRFLPLILLPLVGWTLGTVFLTLGRKAIVQRLEVSAASLTSRNQSRILASIAISAAIWAVMIATPFLIFGEEMRDFANFWRLVNTFPVLLLAMAISYFMGQIAKRPAALFDLLVNVLLLGFLGGMIVEQWNMPAALLRIGRLTPFYWYTRVNDMILLDGGVEGQFFWQALFIQTAYAAAILAIGLVISKENRENKTAPIMKI